MTRHTTSSTRGNRSPHRPSTSAVVAALAAAGLVLTACGSDDAEPEEPTVGAGGSDTGAESTEDPTGGATETVTETETETETATETEPGSDEDPTEAAPEDPTEAAPEELPGEPIEIYPYPGDELTVVAVPAQETLGLYGTPGGADEITRVDPWEVNPVATGNNRMVEDGMWAEVDIDGEVGWVSVEHLAQAGRVTDETDMVPQIDPAATINELAVRVAEQYSPGEPAPTMTVVTDPQEDGEGRTSVIVDVIGLQDDSVRGARLHITATLEGDQYVFDSVENEALCARGVNAEGLCL